MTKGTCRFYKYGSCGLAMNFENFFETSPSDPANFFEAGRRADKKLEEPHSHQISDENSAEMNLSSNQGPILRQHTFSLHLSGQPHTTAWARHDMVFADFLFSTHFCPL